MINVLFFARLRELLGTSALTVTEPVDDVAALRALLAKRGPKWAEYLQSQHALAAVNQTLCEDTVKLVANDEVAFFPPVTGG